MSKANLLPPFKRFCVTIGNLPSSYVDSMSYYECIMWLCKYLKETVVPTVNENAEAVNELIHWFENLDVQEEIDNKLDEMVESGELQEIISAYLNSTAIFGFNTVSDMKSATNLINGSYARTTGYHSLNDGGGATYKIRTVTNDDVVDEMLIIEMADDSLVAELLKPYTPEKMGAYGDGVHDDSDVIQKLFDLIEPNEHIKLKNNYALSKAIKLPIGYGISIDGGTFTALNGFDTDTSEALLYISSESVTQPDNFGVASTGLRLSNMTFMCDFKTDGIEIKRSIQVVIDKCMFHLYKNYGVKVSSLDTHDLIISNCEFKGNTYQGDTSALSNTGILVRADSIIQNCVFGYGYAGIEVGNGGNLIEGCHFYAHQNGGHNLKLGSYDNIVTGCYFDGGGLWLSSGWRNYISDSLFLLGNSTNYIVKVTTINPTDHTADFVIKDCFVHDVRTDTSNQLNFITEYADNITSFSHSKMLNIKTYGGNLNVNSPLDGIQINETNPTFLGLTRYETTVTGSSYGELTPIDGETENYKVRSSGNTLEVEFLDTPSYYKYLVVPFVLTEKSRIIADVTSSASTTVLIWKTDGTYVSNNRRATLEAGTYYLGVYKNVSKVVLHVND